MSTKDVPKGWYSAVGPRDGYEVGVDREVTHSEGGSGYLKSIAPEPKNFGTLFQTIMADNYRSKRLRMAGFAKARDIEKWAALWMRVDGPDNSVLSFDNMHDRPIRATTDWTEYQIILDVPEKSVFITFGVLLGGRGQVWIDDLKIEPVSKDVPTTGGMPAKATSLEPVNTGFDD